MNEPNRDEIVTAHPKDANLARKVSNDYGGIEIAYDETCPRYSIYVSLRS